MEDDLLVEPAPARRLTLADRIVLVASTVLGLWWLKIVMESWSANAFGSSLRSVL